MNKVFLNFTAIVIFFVLSCDNQTTYFSKPVFDEDGKKVGDSLFIDNLIHKIVFTDSSYEIDSVVFSRYNNPLKTVKASNTFMNGKLVFENVAYYENGKVARYRFIDEDNSHYFYERFYNSKGAFVQSKGHLFFQGYVVDSANPSGLKLKIGSSNAFRIYYPNPPDCISNIYIVYNDSGAKSNVFEKSSFLNFLQTTWHDSKDSGYFKTRVLLELIDKRSDTITCSQDLIYEVVSE